MFRCQMCDTIVPAGIRSAKVVVATREKVYEPRGQDPRERRGGRGFRGRRGPRKKKPYDKGGRGVEIVRELAVCPGCATEHGDTPPEHTAAAPTLDVNEAITTGEEAGTETQPETAGAATS